MKDQSLIKRPKPKEHDASARKLLLKAMHDNKTCEICKTAAKDTKYIGYCSLCNLFWWNNCLYADRIIKNSLGQDSGKSPSRPLKDSTKKVKNGVYLKDDKICSCWFAKVIIHYSFVSVLNENGMEDVQSTNNNISLQKEELKDTLKVLSTTSERQERLSKADQEIRKKHRYELEKLKIQEEEFKQIISNEDRLIREYDHKLMLHLETNPEQNELEMLENENAELQYELNKINQELATQNLEIDQMKYTINSFAKSCPSSIDSVAISKWNKSYDLGKSADYFRYQEKTKPIWEEAREEGSYDEIPDFQSKHSFSNFLIYPYRSFAIFQEIGCQDSHCHFKPADH